MKRVRLLLLILPLVAGAFYLRSLASWRPKVLFKGTGEVLSFTFSGDGKTLLVRSDVKRPQLVALDATHDFTPLWTYQEKAEMASPQFFLSDTRILVAGAFIRTLDAKTGQRLRQEEGMSHAVVSLDGTWLASNDLSVAEGDMILKSAKFSGELLLDRFPRSAAQQKGKNGWVIRDWATIPSSYCFSPDGHTLVVNTIAFTGTGRGSRLDFYDVQSWKRTRSWWTDTDSTEKARLLNTRMHQSHDGRFLLCIANFSSPRPPSVQSRVSMWRVRDGQKLSSAILRTQNPSMIGTLFAVPSFEVQNDGRVLQFAANSPVTLSRSSSLQGDFMEVLALPSETITTATLSPDGSSLVAGTASGRVYIQRVE